MLTYYCYSCTMIFLKLRALLNENLLHITWWRSCVHDLRIEWKSETEVGMLKFEVSFVLFFCCIYILLPCKNALMWVFYTEVNVQWVILQHSFLTFWTHNSNVFILVLFLSINLASLLMIKLTNRFSNVM